MSVLPERFWSKVRPAGHDACWEWTASLSAGPSGGYAQYKHEGRVTRGHRLTFQYFIGEIPDGLVLDHLCRNRACVNPYHLEPVTRRENTIRGETLAAQQLKQTHCLNGHELSPDNIYSTRPTRRSCKTCARNSARAAYKLKRSAPICRS
jgi:hypothetical protein